MNEETLFQMALSAPAAERAALLDRECAGQPELRARLDALLQAHAEPAALLTGAYEERTGATDWSVQVNTVIAGRYKLLQQIGEGGMGTVWVAEQTEPVKRKVAIKLIKPGMDSRSVLARFEAERQALAVMDHPNIAKVLDGGLTNEHRPFFVMEYVKGVPITEYCDAARLSIAERLRLFMQVCQAVQHAHQKGIIHRDLKPSNILVAPYDDKPVPKVIDFGLAKAMHQNLTDRTLHTAHEVVLGTPLYMSPEQAQLNNLDVDTRSDIYSLGVLLYELLTGTTPLEKQRFKEAAWDEIRRIIREEDPPRPSTRLSSIDTLPALAARRQAEPVTLTKQLRGELDWIVMKSLEKDRTRRYETATGLARDIDRFLNHEPVSAGPPSAGYKLRKFVQRNRAQVVAVGLVLLALVAGLVGTAWGLVRAEQKRVEAETARAAEAEQRARAESEQKKAEAAFEETMSDFRASTDDAIQNLIGSKPELGPRERAYLEGALRRYQEFARRTGNDEKSLLVNADAHIRIARLWQRLGRPNEALPEFQKGLHFMKQMTERKPQDNVLKNTYAASRFLYAGSLRDLDRLKESIAEFQSAITIYDQLVRDNPKSAAEKTNLANALNLLGEQRQRLGDIEAALQDYTRARSLIQNLAERTSLSDFDRLTLANSRSYIGGVFQEKGRLEEARIEFESSLALYESLALQNPNDADLQGHLITNYLSLGESSWHAGKYAESQKHFESARNMARRIVAQFPTVSQHRQRLAIACQRLGNLHVTIGDSEKALKEFRSSIDLLTRLVEDFPNVPIYYDELANSRRSLALLFYAGGRPADARAQYEALFQLQEQIAARFSANPDRRNSQADTDLNLANVLQSTGEYDLAERHIKRARDTYRALMLEFPGTVVYRRSLSSSLSNLGTLLCERGNFQAARKEMLDALEIDKSLAREFPGEAMGSVKLGGTYCNIGEAFRDDSRPGDSIEWFDSAIVTLKPAHEKNPQFRAAREFLRNAYDGRARACDITGRHADSLADWDRALELSPAMDNHWMRANRATTLLHADRKDDAAAELDRLITAMPAILGFKGWNGPQLYDFARAFALASGGIAGKQQEYSGPATEFIQRTVKAGYRDMRHFQKEKDFESLRDHEDFKRLAAELGNKPEKP